MEMTVLRHVTKVFTSPPSIIWQKVLHKLIHLTRHGAWRVRAFLQLGGISDSSFFQALNIDLASPSSLRDYLVSRTSVVFFFEPERCDNWISMVQATSTSVETLTISAADQACNHTFTLLGSSPMHLGDKIDWHTDFKTGHHFESCQYYANIRPAPYPGGYDIKVPWELSRCQHFAWLGQAYWFTDDEKYAQEFVDQVEDWIASNPWPWGVNWTCTMDVAIRVVNWLWGYHFFLRSPNLSEQFLLSFYKSLLQHGRHICRNLENQGEVTGNHYLSNLVGLVYLGILCPELKEASGWREFGLRELEDEMFKQVYSDGVNFEASTSYHRLTLEMFLSATVLAQHNGHRFSDEYMKRLEQMVEFVMYLTKPDGTFPLIGDNDNGRIHRLKAWNPSAQEWVDFRYLLAIGAVLFRRRDFALAAKDQWGEAIWLFGEEAADLYQRTKQDKNVPFELQSRSFSDSGVYVMRHGGFYLVIDAGSTGRNGKGGHAHNDTLSFELYTRNRTWFLDPGAYIYTQDYRARNQFRSTEFHNTVTVDGHEQNVFDPRECFRIEEDALPSVLEWLSTDEYIWFLGEHSGYQRLPHAVQHRRGYLYHKTMSMLLIVDFIHPPHPYRCVTHLNLAPGVSARKQDGVIALKSSDDRRLVLALSKDQFEAAEIVSGFASLSYGVAEQTTRIHWQWSGQEHSIFSVDLDERLPSDKPVSQVRDLLYELLAKYGIKRNYV